MKVLKDLLFGVNIESVMGTTSTKVSSIAYDSRKVTADSLFVAIKGGVTDGHAYLDQAIQQGATAILVEQMPDAPNDKVTWICTQNSREALAIVASHFYGNPSKDLKLIGVTGTNGKTTITTLLYDLFEKSGYPSGLISTVVIKYDGLTQPATHTTPDPLVINAHLKAMVERGVSYCFMEVSSHGIDQERTQGLVFAGGVFTNLTHDHLDYHPSFAAYRDVKKRFFDALPKTAFVLTNADDKNGAYMVQNTKAKKYTYAQRNYADYRVQILESQFSGMLLKINQKEVWSRLVGGFNASNILAVFAVAECLDLDALATLSYLSELKNVRGRFETYSTPNQATIVVDYAHTPDALENVLETINQIRTKNEQLITVVGCGGDRDKDKRPLMGKIAAQKSTKVIFTSDNPRSEDPLQIITEMEAGVSPEDYKKTMSIADREAAIKAACVALEPQDVLLIAGKGHETYQEIQGKRTHFDDLEVVQRILKKMNT